MTEKSGTRSYSAGSNQREKHAEGKASQNKRQKRDSLLNNAFELFTQKGITNTTISDIAEKAGVAKGTFYLYFKDKYDLRDRLVRHEAEQILMNAYEAMKKAKEDADSGKAEPLPLDTLEDQVVFFADNILEQLSNNKILLRFITKNLGWGLLKHDIGGLTTSEFHEDFPRESENFEDGTNLITVLDEFFRSSAIQYKNPEVLLYMIVEFIGSTCYSSILESDPLPIDQLKPYLLEGVRAIMRSQEVRN